MEICVCSVVSTVEHPALQGNGETFICYFLLCNKGFFFYIILSIKILYCIKKITVGEYLQKKEAKGNEGNLSADSRRCSRACGKPGIRLTGEQVGRAREKCGWNELAEGKKKSILQIFFEQYKDFLVLILIASE